MMKQQLKQQQTQHTCKTTTTTTTTQQLQTSISIELKNGAILCLNLKKTSKHMRHIKKHHTNKTDWAIKRKTNNTQQNTIHKNPTN